MPCKLRCGVLGFVELMVVSRCVNRNFCNGRGKITRSRNNRLTFKKDRRGFLVSAYIYCNAIIAYIFAWTGKFVALVAFSSAFQLVFFPIQACMREREGTLGVCCDPPTPARQWQPCVEHDLDVLFDLNDFNDLDALMSWSKTIYRQVQQQPVAVNLYVVYDLDWF